MRCRVRGWAEGFGRDVASVVEELAAAGAAVVMVTEISRDGLMVGPDLAGYRVAAEELRSAADRSGGTWVSLDDIRRLARLHELLDGALRGSIVGQSDLRGTFQRPRPVPRGAPA